VNDVKEPAQLVDLEQFAGQGAGEIKPESVDVHLFNPVPQAVHDQLQHMGILHIERVATPREIHVIPGILGEPVVGSIVHAAKRKGRAALISLGGMVVDDIQNHLDPCGMQAADHRLELLHSIQRPRLGVVTRFRREEPQRVVPPVIRQPAFQQMAVIDMTVNWQQFDRSDAERLQVIDGRVRCQSRISPAQRFRNPGMPLCKPAHVKFVDHALVNRRIRAALVAPG